MRVFSPRCRSSRERSRSSPARVAGSAADTRSSSQAGAKLVVNDLGGSLAGEGNDLSPAQQVVAEIEAAGGEAIANGANVADFTQAGELVQAAIDAFGRLDILVNNAGSSATGC
jgi:Dehydrogenases with different specificities (related to short-chain alcohol dehydrogenases)